MDLALGLSWTVGSGDKARKLDPALIEILLAVREGGHLNYAANAAGVSYRHAWGLVRDWEQRIGISLLNARRGRGAELTAFADALLEITAQTESALSDTLEKAALEASAQLSEASQSLLV